jgi:hypothetical protein
VFMCSVFNLYVSLFCIRFFPLGFVRTTGLESRGRKACTGTRLGGERKPMEIKNKGMERSGLFGT